MLAKLDPWIVRLLSVMLAAGLYIIASYFPAVVNDLKVLAGIVVGWLALPRPGDSRTTGVHPDDISGSRS